MVNPKEYATKTKEQIRDDYLRTIAFGLQKLGIQNPNVSKGTYDYIKAEALGTFGEDIYNILEIKLNAQLPDSAENDDLVRLAKIVGLALREAGPSQGFIVLATNVAVPVVIPTGAQLIDDAGLTYEVIVGSSYSADDLIEIRSIDTGVGTNLAENAVLRWTNPPPFVSQTAKVGPGGLVGGVDKETYGALQERLLAYYRNPPGGGNWSQVNLTAEQSSTFVEKAFTYPGVYGPSTMHVALVGAQTETNKNRIVPLDVVNNVVAPVIIGTFPEFADIVITNTSPYVVSVAFKLALPASKKASPPGTGGGWIDGTPWPKANLTPISVISVDFADTFTVTSPTPPVIGNSICYISPSNFKFYRGIIKNFIILAPTIYKIILDTGFFLNDATNTPIVAGDWIFPDAERMDVYVQTIFDAFAGLGPGEKTTIPGLFPRAARKPQKEIYYPVDVDSTFLRKLVQAGDEVKDASFVATPFPSPVNNGYQLAPFLVVPGQLAIYPA